MGMRRVPSENSKARQIRANLLISLNLGRLTSLPTLIAKYSPPSSIFTLRPPHMDLFFVYYFLKNKNRTFKILRERDAKISRILSKIRTVGLQLNHY